MPRERGVASDSAADRLDAVLGSTVVALAAGIDATIREGGEASSCPSWCEAPASGPAHEYRVRSPCGSASAAAGARSQPRSRHRQRLDRDGHGPMRGSVRACRFGLDPTDRLRFPEAATCDARELRSKPRHLHRSLTVYLAVRTSPDRNGSVDCRHNLQMKVSDNQIMLVG